MAKDSRPIADSITLPPQRLSVGVTGHRGDNAKFAAHHAAIERTLATIFETIDAAVASHADRFATTRLHSLLADGADMMAMEQALARGWEVVAPLPFGLDLNIAINCRAASEADALALISGGVASDPEVAARAGKMRRIAGSVRLFALAEQDEHVTRHFLAAMRDPGDREAGQAYSVLTSERTAAAGRVMIEHSDLLIAVWDGVTPGGPGGTRHSMASALHDGAPVIWIDAANPDCVRILQGPESLEVSVAEHSCAEIEAFVANAINPPDADRNEAATRFHTEKWHAHSSRRFHAYRRIEALFGGKGKRRFFTGLVETYETPEAIAEGSGAPVLTAARALPGTDDVMVRQIEEQVLGRFAWADGLSTYLSDAYRGGMVTNFLLSALAIAVGAAYIPLVDAHWKWPFAVVELLLLLAIVAITATGRKRRWHGRWFETRRVAEYLRHAPILLLLGVARPPGRWPRGSNTQWPEFYARHALRELGLPATVVTQGYLRAALESLLAGHAQRQREYHVSKAARLTRVHHRLDRLSEILFMLAILSIAVYLLLVAAGSLELVPEATAYKVAKQFTFLGVVLPALGGAFAGIRYFGDFERFAAISEVTAEKLQVLETRTEKLLASTDQELRYEQVAGLAHAMDDIVIAEIESWQSVFAAKNIAVPV
ncbi:MAG: hypothetical protein ACXWUP_00375 [Allosphingosinicella sp.]